MQNEWRSSRSAWAMPVGPSCPRPRCSRKTESDHAARRAMAGKRLPRATYVRIRAAIKRPARGGGMKDDLEIRRRRDDEGCRRPTLSSTCGCVRADLRPARRLRNARRRVVAERRVVRKRSRQHRDGRWRSTSRWGRAAHTGSRRWPTRDRRGMGAGALEARRRREL